MTIEDPIQGGQERVNLAMQVANIAAQASAAIRSGSLEKREELADTLLRARARLAQNPTPEGLLPFIDVVCGLLRRQEISGDATALPTPYRAVYDQLVDETQRDSDEGELTLGEVLEEVGYNVVAAMRQGTPAQRRMMANTLQRMQQESAHRPDLNALIDLLEAARALLLDEDWAPHASQLRGPFQVRWEEILNAIRE
jgi:hypothetical protein